MITHREAELVAASLQTNIAMLKGMERELIDKVISGVPPVYEHSADHLLNMVNLQLVTLSKCDHIVITTQTLDEINRVYARIQERMKQVYRRAGSLK